MPNICGHFDALFENMNRPLANTKLTAIKWQLTCLQKKVDELANTYDQLDLATHRLDDRLKQRARTLQRGSYLLHMMELFFHRPQLAMMLTRYVSSFFKLLLSHVESSAPEGPKQPHITCIRQLWSLERRSRELRRCRHRFCQQRHLSSELLAVLTEIHDVFSQYSLPDITDDNSDVPSNERRRQIQSILKDIDEEVTDLTVATALKRTVMAVENGGVNLSLRSVSNETLSLQSSVQV